MTSKLNVHEKDREQDRKTRREREKGMHSKMTGMKSGGTGSP